MTIKWNQAIKKTPLLNEYFIKKEEYPGHLILMQVGKFYEAYGEDASILRDKLGLKIATKGNLRMAGIPTSTLETYGRLLIEQGIKIVCINQDEENTRDENNLVVRKVVGIYTQSINPFLNREKSNYLLTIKFEEYRGCRSKASRRGAFSSVVLAFIDLIVGELYTETLNRDELTSFIAKIQPVEILVCDSDLKCYRNLMSSLDKTTVIPAEAFSPNCLSLLKTGLNIKEIRDNHRKVVGSIIWYCFRNQFLTLNHIRYCGLFNCSKFLKLENFTITNLELQEPLRAGGRTLFQVLDKTKTAMGRRELKKRLLFPSCDPSVIEHRLNWVEFFKDRSKLSEQLQELLDGVGDLARLINKASWEFRDPRHVLSLAESLTQVNNIKELLISSDSVSAVEASPKHTGAVSENFVPKHQVLVDQLSVCTEFRENVFNTLEPQSPFEDGNWIKFGVCKELDRLKASGFFEQREKLMLELTKQLGFKPKLIETKDGWVCEFTHYQSKKLNACWQIHSSSKKKVKYSHPLLQDFDLWYQTTGRTITKKIEQLEFREYLKLVAHAVQIREKVQKTALQLAHIDISVALGISAQAYNYTRPVITTELMCWVDQGRHPVLEHQVDYIANNCYLGQIKALDISRTWGEAKGTSMMIITGANMGGKSAFVRQIALISIMAQMGSFVPAKKAILGIRDSIFVRLGGFDNLSLNQSTFMVEMTEVASILKDLTPRSLVVLDEIGRGTSFVDGFALACSILEHLHNHKFIPHVLCTTHFSELTQVSNHLVRCQNFMMQSNIKNNKLYNSYSLIKGVCKNSLGVETAQAAALPVDVINRARELRNQLYRTVKPLVW